MSSSALKSCASCLASGCAPSAIVPSCNSVFGQVFSPCCLRTASMYNSPKKTEMKCAASSSCLTAL
eukprot:5875861-Lingulodinium_polyedra.AAC.1